MSAYATTEELAAYLGAPAPDDAARLLERASEAVDELVCARFRLDPGTGLVLDARIAAALSGATCAVAEQWLEVGEANDVDGLAGSSVTVGGAGGYTGRRAPAVAPRAVRILKSAGLA